MVSGFERFILSITEIDRYWNKFAAEEMEKHGLKSPYAFYLIVLYNNAGGLTPGELCEISCRNKADVSRAMRDMQSNGLVRKESNGKNIYRAKMVLTESGIEAARNICDSIASSAFAGSKAIDENQCESLYKTLETISDNLFDAAKSKITE